MGSLTFLFMAAKIVGVDRNSAVGYNKDVATLLQKLHSIVNTIGELRNNVGADHGAARTPGGVGSAVRPSGHTKRDRLVRIHARHAPRS